MDEKIRYDSAGDMILIPCGDRGEVYEVERYRFACREAVETLVDELSCKAWMTARDVAEVERLALSVLAAG